MAAQEDAPGNIRVVCRFRPLNEKETQLSNNICATFEENKTVVINPSNDVSGPMRFNYDWVFPPQCEQKDIYEVAGKPIAEAVMQGFNGTIFAYGQTSSGKTFTMTGASIEDPQLMGIIPRMVTKIFDQIANSDEHVEFTVKVAYAEIYLEKIKDLLDPSKDNLKVHEDKTRGVYIADLTENYVSSEEEVYELMRIGTDNREVAYTHMNAGSSRSHSLFILTISQNNTLDYSAKTGKLYLVDLAGSEKISKTGAAGKRLEEAKNINKSLTTLGQVINALTDGKSSHVPYRDSKLTRVLQDSLGGNSKTSLIVTCSPSPYNEAETISTLRFGIRAKAIKNKPKVNKEYTVAELKLMLAKAKEEISKRDTRIKSLENALKGAGAPLPSDYVEESKKEEYDQESNKDESEYDEVIQELEDTRQRLSEEVGAHTKLKHDFSELEAELESIKSQVQEVNDKNYTLEEKVTKYKTEAKQKEEQSEKLLLTKESLESELSSLNETKLELEQKLNEKAVEIDQLQIEAKMNRQGNLQSAEEKINELNSELEEERNRNSEYQKDIQTLQRKLNESLSSSVHDLNQIKDSMREEIVRQEREKWVEEKRAILRDLQNRVDKVVSLEIELDEARESYKNLESTMSEGERNLKKKTDTLERNLEQLTLMYHQLVSQKSMLKVDKQVNERKIQRLNERNKNLEEQLKKQKELSMKLEHEINSLKDERLSFQPSFSSNRATLGPGFPVSTKIKKTIRGGGGGRLFSQTPRNQTVTFSKAPNEPDF